jgi:YtkA-like
MRPIGRDAVLQAVTVASRNRTLLVWLSLAALGLVGVIVALVVSAGSQSRGSVLRALQQPAVFPAAFVGPGPVDQAIPAGGDTLALRMTPNRASLRNEITATVTEHGRTVDGTRVTVTYSMPAMDMWGGLQTALIPAGGGRYRANEPILGMPGIWQLRITVAPPGAHAFAVVVNDRMNS